MRSLCGEGGRGVDDVVVWRGRLGGIQPCEAREMMTKYISFKLM